MTRSAADIIFPDPAAPLSSSSNPVVDPVPGALSQQEEQRRREAEWAAKERRVKEAQDKIAHDDRQLNTVAPLAPAAPVINPEGLTPDPPLSLFTPLNDFCYHYPIAR